MNWNHRILAHKKGEETYFEIHEVYYNKEGKPYSYTEKGVSIIGEDLEEVNWVLDKMKECVNKPILSADDFPKEYESKTVG